MDAMTTSLEFSMTMRKENTPRGFLSQMPHPKAARENWCKNNAIFIYKALKEGLLMDCHILEVGRSAVFLQAHSSFLARAHANLLHSLTG